MRRCELRFTNLQMRLQYLPDQNTSPSKKSGVFIFCESQNHVRSARIAFFWIVWKIDRKIMEFRYGKQLRYAEIVMSLGENNQILRGHGEKRKTEKNDVRFWPASPAGPRLLSISFVFRHKRISVLTLLFNCIQTEYVTA